MYGQLRVVVRRKRYMLTIVEGQRMKRAQMAKANPVAVSNRRSDLHELPSCGQYSPPSPAFNADFEVRGNLVFVPQPGCGLLQSGRQVVRWLFAVAGFARG